MSCPPSVNTPPDPNALQRIQDQGTKEVLNALGAQTCKEASVGGSMNFMGMGGDYNAGGSVGCETISIIAQAVSDTKTVLNCVLNNSSSSSDTEVNVGQSIQVTFNNVKLRDCSINISNKLKMTANLKSSIANVNNVDLSNALTSMVKQVSDNVSKIDKVGGVPLGGNKVVSKALTVVSSEVNNTAISNMVSSTMTKYRAQQDIVINVSNADIAYSTALQNPCFNLENNMLLDLIVSDLIQNTLSTVFTTDVKSEIAQETKNDAAQTTTKGNTDMSIILIVAGVIILGVAWYINKNKGNYLLCLKIAAGLGALLLIGGIVGWAILATGSPGSIASICLMVAGGVTLMVAGGLYFKKRRELILLKPSTTPHPVELKTLPALLASTLVSSPTLVVPLLPTLVVPQTVAPPTLVVPQTVAPPTLVVPQTVAPPTLLPILVAPPTLVVPPTVASPTLLPILVAP